MIKWSLVKSFICIRYELHHLLQAVLVALWCSNKETLSKLPLYTDVANCGAKNSQIFPNLDNDVNKINARIPDHD